MGQLDERGRRLADEAEREKLLAAFAASGMTQRAFALREGINYFTFATWLAAAFTLRLLGHLYRMEREWDERKIRGAERARLRTRDFELTLRLLKKAALLLARSSLPKSSLGKACHYLLGQWDALVAHCKHGDTRIDTNHLENAIRAVGYREERITFLSGTLTPVIAPRLFTRLSSAASDVALIRWITSATS